MSCTKENKFEPQKHASQHFKLNCLAKEIKKIVIRKMCLSSPAEYREEKKTF